MRTFTLIEEDQPDQPARLIYIRGDGGVTVYDVGRTLRCRVALDGAETTWQLLERVMPGIAQAEAVTIKIARLVERLQTGWRLVAGEIDPDIPQRHLNNAHFAIDALAYPDDPEEPYYTPATKLMGHERGLLEATGEILWIDAAREWAVCDDGFWWLREGS